MGFPLEVDAFFSVVLSCCAGGVGLAFPGAAGGEALGFPLEVFAALADWVGFVPLPLVDVDLPLSVRAELLFAELGSSTFDLFSFSREVSIPKQTDFYESRSNKSDFRKIKFR